MTGKIAESVTGKYSFLINLSFQQLFFFDLFIFDAPPKKTPQFICSQIVCFPHSRNWAAAFILVPRARLGQDQGSCDGWLPGVKQFWQRRRTLPPTAESFHSKHRKGSVQHRDDFPALFLLIDSINCYVNKQNKMTRHLNCSFSLGRGLRYSRKNMPDCWHKWVVLFFSGHTSYL